MEGEMRKCPYCGTMNKLDAFRCKNEDCLEILPFIDKEIDDVLRKWNKNSTEEVYWELMMAGAGEDIAGMVISDEDLLDKYFQLRNQLRQEGVPNKSALLRIAMYMQDLIAKD